MEYFKNVERKLSDTKKDLHAAEMRNAEMQEALKSATAVELDNTKLKQKVETLQKEKVEAEKRQKMHIEVNVLSIELHINVKFTRLIFRVSRILSEGEFVHSNQTHERNVGLEEQLRNRNAKINGDYRGSEDNE